MNTPFKGIPRLQSWEEVNYDFATRRAAISDGAGLASICRRVSCQRGRCCDAGCQ